MSATVCLDLESIGEYTQESDKVRVTDPCYGRHTWCSAVCKVLPGTWKCAVVRHDYGDWGERIQALVAYHESVPIEQVRDVERWWEVFAGTIGVDSGQAGFFDDKYYQNPEVIEGVPRMHDKCICAEDPWYSLCCDRTLHAGQAGVIPYGCVSSSGFGDGGYVLRVQTADDGMLRAMMIIFCSSDDEDDEEDD